MSWEQRAIRCLGRRKGRSLLLLSVLLVIGTMILTSTMILQTAQSTSRAIQEKTRAKLVLQGADGESRITPELTARILAYQDVASVNRASVGTASPSGFSPVTGSDSPDPDNSMVTLHAYDNTETDGVFAEGAYRMLEGTAINEEHPHGVLINSLLAEENGLALGDPIRFETAQGTTASGTVTGIFSSGMERRQEASILSIYRIENQIFVDHAAYEALFGAQNDFSLSVFSSDPAHPDDLADRIQEIAGEGIRITASDTLYTELQAPLQQVIRITSLMLALILATATVVVSFLLCMWMRSRQKEFAILISLGESKLHLMLQVVVESMLLFLLSFAGAACCTGLLSGAIIRALFSSGELSRMADVHIQWKHLLSYLALGGWVLLIAVWISIAPILRANPRDILSRMEE